MVPKLTKYQQHVFDFLCDGGRLNVEMSGFYFKHQKLRVETSDALLATGELALVKVSGSHFALNFIVHTSQVSGFVSRMDSLDKTVLSIIDPYS